MRIFCNHMWETLGKDEWIDTSFRMKWPKTTYHQKCRKCGKLQIKTLDFHIKKDVKNEC